MAKIYVASSWRNLYHERVVRFLRDQGHEVYDFRAPEGRTGFQWSEIDENWQRWDVSRYRTALEHPIACAVSVRLHKTDDDTVEDFIDKMKLLRDEIDCFIEYLENT